MKEINSSSVSSLNNDGHFHTVRCKSHRHKPGCVKLLMLQVSTSQSCCILT